jgi:hypothetical protein
MPDAVSEGVKLGAALKLDLIERISSGERIVLDPLRGA